MASLQSDKHRWTILAAILIGTLIGTFGNSTANIAVPSIMDAFQIPLSSAVWLVTLYTLAFSVLMPVTGGLGYQVGHRRLYLGGMALIVVASLAAGLATSFPMLLGARALQGIGIAPTLPVVMVIIARTFTTEKRGLAMGLWAMVNGAGHALGPAIGGVLIEHIGWRSIFLMNIPLCLICIYLVWKVVPNDALGEVRRFDIPGAAALTISALAGMLALTMSAQLSLGSSLSVMLWSITVVSLVAFFLIEKRSAGPLVDTKLFGNPRYTAAIAVISAEAFCLFGLLLALPVFLIQALGWSSQVAGLLPMLMNLTMALSGPFAGRFSDRQGSRLPCVLGMGAVAAGGLMLITTQWIGNQTIGWGLVLVCLVLIGAGMGLTQSPVTAAVVQTVREEQVGVATGVFHMLRFISGALGSTIFGLILENNPGGITGGFYKSLLVVAAAAGLAFLASWALPGPKIKEPVSAAVINGSLKQEKRKTKWQWYRK